MSSANSQGHFYDSIAYIKDTELIGFINQAGAPFIQKKDSAGAAKLAVAWQATAQNQHNLRNQIAAYTFAGNVYKKLGGANSALINYKAALQLVDGSSEFVYLQPVLTHQIGWLYYQEDQNALGLENLITANMLMERLGYDHFPEIPEYLYELGYGYAFYYEDFTSAAIYIKKALSYPVIDPQTDISCHKILGILHREAKQLPASRAELDIALLKATQQKDTANIGEITGDIGYNYYLEGKLDSSLRLIRIDYQYSFLKENWSSACLSKLLMASIAIQQNRLDSAVAYKNEVLQLIASKKEGFTNKVYYILGTSVYRVIIKLEKQLGNDKATIAAQDSLDYFRTKLSNTKDSKEQAAVQIKLINANKDYQLQLFKSEEGRKVLVRNALIVLFLLIAIIALLIARQQKQKASATENKLTNYANRLVENNQLLEQFRSEMEQLKHQPEKIEPELDELFKKLRTRTLLTEKDRQVFKTDFEHIYKNFFSNIKEQIPDISPAEMRLIALIKLDLSAQEMAEMQGISPDSITKAKYRLRKKIESSARENSDLNTILKNVNKG